MGRQADWPMRRPLIAVPALSRRRGIQASPVAHACDDGGMASLSLLGRRHSGYDAERLPGPMPLAMSPMLPSFICAFPQLPEHFVSAPTAPAPISALARATTIRAAANS